jgi:hypothetical protein
MAAVSGHSFNIGSALLNAMTLCQLIKAIDDFNGKFGISGVGDHTACLKLIKKISCFINKY